MCRNAACVFSLRGYCALSLLWAFRALPRSETAVNGEFLFCFLFVPGSLECRSKRVVDLRISRREALRAAQWGNCLFIFFQTHETKPLAEIGLRKIGIELDRLRELWNCLLAFLIPARKFSQNVVCAGITRIDRNFLEELLPGTFRGFGSGIRPREKQPAQQEVDAANVRVFLDYRFVLKLSRSPTYPAFRGLQRSTYVRRWIAEHRDQDPGLFALIGRNRRGRLQRGRPGPCEIAWSTTG